MNNKTTVIALSSSQKLAKQIAALLGTELCPANVHHFADGEILVSLEESVRGKHVYVVQSTSAPVTENLMELLICVDALKRSSATEITAVIPYFGYARQDRKAKARQPITAKLVADLLQTTGVDRVVTVDLHAAQIQGFFDIPVDDMTGLPLLSNYFKAKNIENLTVVSPDHGGANRARKLANALDVPLAIIDKRRPKPNVAEVTGIIGDVEGRNCIMVDDMIDTGGTIAAGAKALKDKGAKDVYIACTHAVFSGPAPERLQNSVAKEVVVTDTIELNEKKHFDKLVTVSIADLLASTIYNIENAKPVSEVFEKYDFMDF
ncbi:MAG: ribose-phosphate pyrophosphokinase [Erysipelotrichaceae bacterium]|nr:ribose-phosphate pyrophosphokinase [Erysipelotrichaceae bacterium]